jgi:phosphatidylcholine synthase
VKWKKLCAAGVHAYTCIGVILAFVAALALMNEDIQWFLTALWLAVFIDATDGAMARSCDVKTLLPGFDGSRLDDIIDYLTYAFLPALGLVKFGVLEPQFTWAAMVPILASAYGFCQENAKTEESFVGFPSYWNAVFLYLFILPMPQAVMVGLLLLLSILVFVPIEYIYPSKTRWLRVPTLSMSCAYGLLIGAVCLDPQANWAMEAVLLSLIYPVYYAVISVMYTQKIRKKELMAQGLDG